MTMAQTMVETKEEKSVLEIPEITTVKNELMLVDPATITLAPAADPQMEKMAESFVKMAISFDPNDPKNSDARMQNAAAVENLGSGTQRQAAERSAMLKQPIRKLMAKSEDGGVVAKALVDLNVQIEELDPVQLGEPGWGARLLGMIPGVGSPIKKYFMKYESAQTIIDAIMVSLEHGSDTLKKDNYILAQDQQRLREMTFKLEKAIQLAMLIDRKLEYALEREIDPDDANRVKFVQEELIFPLRQKITDLQQQLAVTQQGVLSIEIIIRTNKELIRGVDRAIKVTVTALYIAVLVAQALADQKIVLDKIQAVNKTTNHLIAHNAKQLRQQAAETNKQAASAMLDIETLKGAFADIRATIEDISTFRRNALPKMAGNILEMDQLTKTTEEAIRRMEEGNKAMPAIELDVDELAA